MATIWPRCCNTSTIWYLCSGKTWAKPSACSIASAICPASCGLASSKRLASIILLPRSSCRPISLAIATWLPVTILTSSPISLAASTVDLESSRNGSKRGITPINCHCPCSFVRATPRDRKPRAAKSFTTWLTFASILEEFESSIRITWGAPLVTLKSGPSIPFTVASVRLWTGSKGWKWVTWYCFNNWLSLTPASTVKSIVSWSSAREASAAFKINWSALIFSNVKGSPIVSLFWVSVPVLSEQRISTPASSSIEESLVTIACFIASTRAPNAIVTDSTAGIATGTDATVRTSTNCNTSRSWSCRKMDTTNMIIASAIATPMR